LAASNPATFRLSETVLSALGGAAAGMLEGDQPTAKGMLIHAVAFMLIIFFWVL
jgi:hypothetical protein